MYSLVYFYIHSIKKYKNSYSKTVMTKKLFVVLEQGNKCNTSLSYEHKSQFNTDYCDWFRLNWRNDRNDKNASFFGEKIVWSEGRSLLYDKVREQYEYFIFIDDDVQFVSKTTNDVAMELKTFFEKYRPLTGTVYGDNWAWNSHKTQIETDNKEAFPIMGHDLCCHYFQADFAEHIFPVYFHGSGRCMWYAQFIGHTLYPEKCLVVNTVYVKNTEHLPHSDKTNESYNDPSSVTRQFSKMIKNEKHREEFNRWNDVSYVINKNKEIYTTIGVDMSKVEFTEEILDSIIAK